MELLPLPLACRVAEVIGTTTDAYSFGNLLPLDFRQSLFVIQRVVMVRVDAVEILYGKLGQKFELCVGQHGIEQQLLYRLTSFSRQTGLRTRSCLALVKER
jgi:hypothetical protein